MTKNETYKTLLSSIASLIDGERDLITIMSTISCEVFHAFDDLNWVGFYRRTDHRTLKVGPYQGTHGCLTIDFDQGVCGACARSREIQLWNDISMAPSHIACSSLTQAELVLPIIDKKGELFAVFDLDSVKKNIFDGEDVEALSQICDWIAERT